MKNVQAALAYFGLSFGAGFALGVIRVPFLVPRLGERMAELIEMPIMFAVIFFAARYVVRKFAVPPTTGPRLAVGALAILALIAAELAMVVWLRHQPIGEYVASRDPVSGSVYLFMLGVFALMPLLVGRTQSMQARG